MAAVQDLVNFIQQNPPEGKYWTKQDWSDALDQSVPGWQDIIKNPDHWPDIEKARPRSNLNNLRELFLERAGVGLANRWFKSGDADLAEAVVKWLDRNVINGDLSTSLSVELWRGFIDELKRLLVLHVFDKYPGEPFETLKKLKALYYRFGRFWDELWSNPKGFPNLRDFSEIRVPLLTTGYVPSRQVWELRSIVEEAGDRKFLEFIDGLIAQREKASQFQLFQAQLAQVTSQHILYTPSRDERELIALLIEKARRGGFRASTLPEIILSFEAPPLFVAYPELEEEEGTEEEQGERLVPRRRNRGRPDTISVEEVLGCYVPTPQIRLYARGLSWLARRNGFDEEVLRAVVLIHEVAHWVSHLLPKPGLPEWPLELYKQTEEKVHEGWAQLLTWWVVDEVGGQLKTAFEELNKLQSPAYRVFERFKDKSVGAVMASLEKLRQLPRPARLEDWEGFLS